MCSYLKMARVKSLKRNTETCKSYDYESQPNVV